jgi:hypothetical protein
MVAQLLNPSTWEVKAKRLAVQGLPGIHSDIKISLDYKTRLFPASLTVLSQKETKSDA